MNDTTIHYLHPRVEKLEDLVHAIDKKLDVSINNQHQHSNQLKDLTDKVNILANQYKEEEVKRRFIAKVVAKAWPIIVKLTYLGVFTGVMFLFSPANNDNILMAIWQSLMQR